MKTPLIAATSGVVVLLSSALPSFAADQPLEIVITAGRKAQTLKETLAPVTMITREDIKRWQATDVADVLRRVPSLVIGNFGGTGQLTSVFLRGTNSSHVLVLIDGVKVGSATSGTTAFEFLPLEQVERIEVVRGPRSSLYGSEAIGGVIQIFTRRDSARGFKPSASVSVGTENTRKAHVNLAGGNGNSWFNANIGTEKTDGINALAVNWDGSLNPEPDKDGFKSNHVSLRIGHRFANGASLEASGLQAKGDNYYDTGNSRREFLQQVISAKAIAPVGVKSTLSLQLSQARDEQDAFSGAVFSNRFNTTRDNATLQLDSTISVANKLTVGMDTQKDQVNKDISNSDSFSVTKRTNQGIFANYQQTLGTVQIDTALRHDDNEQFGKATTGSIGIGKNLTTNTRMSVSYGTAFKAPTFTDLYAPSSWASNPNLQPEKSRNLELGLQGQLAQGYWYTQVFNNTIDNLIVYDSASNRVQNVNKAKIKGLEAGITNQINTWQTQGNITFQQPENALGVNSGKWLQRRPQVQAKLDLDRAIGRGSVGASVQAFGKRYEDAANIQKIAGYSTLDLRAQYPLAKNLTLGVKLGNIFDKRYETVKGYNQLGRNGLVTLSYSPK